MKARTRIIVAASACLVAAVAPAHAQDSSAQDSAPPQNEVVGPPQISDFSLNGTVTRNATAPTSAKQKPAAPAEAPKQPPAPKPETTGSRTPPPGQPKPQTTGSRTPPPNQPKPSEAAKDTAPAPTTAPPNRQCRRPATLRLSARRRTAEPHPPTQSPTRRRADPFRYRQLRKLAGRAAAYRFYPGSSPLLLPQGLRRGSSCSGCARAKALPE